MADRLRAGGPHGAYRIATAMAIAGAVLLIYWTGTSRPMWVDEEMLALNVRNRPFTRLAGSLWLDQSAPLAWLALERLFMLTFGTGERAVRLLTVLCGIGTLTTGVWIGRRWMTPVGAAVLVALLAFGEWMVFFTLELKHYSSDTLWALLLPALAARAFEGYEGSGGQDRSGDSHDHRQITRWWMVATVGMWFSNGALFVTPLCGLILFAASVPQEGRQGNRAARRMLPGGLVWVLSFAACYALVLRYALENTYLKIYWAFAFPPVSEGLDATLRWVIAQPVPFATKPVSSGLPIAFWSVYTFGMVLAIGQRSRLAVMFATVPVSALALALFRMVPTFERLALWFVPALYVGVALCADLAVRLGREAAARRKPIRLAIAGAAGAAAVVVCADIVWRGVLALDHRPHSNYGLDDRSSVRWLLATERPGDVVMTTHYGLAAIWWYAGVGEPGGFSHLADGVPLFEIGHVPPGPECDAWNATMTRLLSEHRRVVVYLGFRMNVEPVGFGTFVLQELGRRGAMVGYKEYAEESRIAVFEINKSPVNAAGALVIPAAPAAIPAATAPPVAGCLAVRPAERW